MKTVIILLLTLKLIQTCVRFCLQLNTKEDILKNVGNQTNKIKILWKSVATTYYLVTNILQTTFYV